jgi:hypothetical protein
VFNTISGMESQVGLKLVSFVPKNIVPIDTRLVRIIFYRTIYRVAPQQLPYCYIKKAFAAIILRLKNLVVFVFTLSYLKLLITNRAQACFLNLVVSLMTTQAWQQKLEEIQSQ